MPALEAIETKIRRLQRQAEALKAKKTSATLGRIVALMEKSGVTVADIETHFGGKPRDTIVGVQQTTTWHWRQVLNNESVRGIVTQRYRPSGSPRA